MSWNQPICSLCYGKREPGRSPTAIVEAMREVERCCLCGQNTKEGIYYRIDPATVSFPKEEEREDVETVNTDPSSTPEEEGQGQEPSAPQTAPETPQAPPAGSLEAAQAAFAEGQKAAG